MNDQKIHFQISQDQKETIELKLRDLLKQKITLEQSIKNSESFNRAKEEDLYLELLGIFDSLDFLLNYLSENQEFNPALIKRLPKNLANIQKKLINILEKRLVKLIEIVDGKLDYSCCQVVDQEIRTDLPEKSITKVVRSGFKIGDKVLRPAQVIISK
jgi:molecular chaperone GrpE